MDKGMSGWRINGQRIFRTLRDEAGQQRLPWPGVQNRHIHFVAGAFEPSAVVHAHQRTSALVAGLGLPLKTVGHQLLDAGFLQKNGAQETALGGVHEVRVQQELRQQELRRQ